MNARISRYRVCKQTILIYIVIRNTENNKDIAKGSNYQINIWPI